MKAATRPYRMTARAQAAAATGERILDAAIEVFWQRPSAKVSLDEVARRSGVTVQTVIRHFGGREGVMAAVARRETEKVRREREIATPGDVEEAVRTIVGHYERTGERVLRMLAEEERSPALAEFVERGRVMHREWCQRTFAPALDGLTGVAAARRLAQLVAVCDVYTWKLLRHDGGLSRRQTELAMGELLKPLMQGEN